MAEVPELLSLVIDKYLANHDQPITKQYPGSCWEFGSGDYWFSMNGSSKELIGGPEGGMQPEIPAFSLGVFHKGWLLGFVDPGGGCMVGGHEDLAIQALKDID